MRELKKNGLSTDIFKGLIVITGVPGTGKTTLAKKLSEVYSYKFIDCNSLAIEKKCVIGKTKEAEKIINLNKLRSALLKEINIEKSKNLIIEGHLACEIKLPADVVLVLRCHPSILRKRLLKRGYDTKKINNNVLAEIGDYCLVQSELNYRQAKIISVNNSKGKSVIEILKQIRQNKSEQVDFSKLLLKNPYISMLNE